jgi:hypothetical protein
VQRWETRARRWEARAAERRSKRRLGKGLGVAQGGEPTSLANDNDDVDATQVTPEMGAIGNAAPASTEVVASDMVA